MTQLKIYLQKLNSPPCRASLIADTGVMSLITVRPNTFEEIDPEMFSTVIFLLLLIRVVPFQLQSKVCAQWTSKHPA